MLRRIALAVEVSIFVLACAEAGAGQGFQGGLRGSIRDTGGGVPGAAVTLTNEDTNLARATFSNAQGEYAFAAVEPGSYRVKVTMAGFKTIERVRRSHRHPEFPRPRSWSRSRFPRGIDHRLGADAAHRNRQRLARHRARPRDARDAAGTRPRRLPDGGLDSDRRSPLATASSTGSRISRTRRSSRSAAARAAATTTRLMASRSPTSSTAPSPIRPWKRSTTSRCRCIPTMPRWGAPAAACSTRRCARERTRCAALASSRRVRSGARRTTTSASSPAGRSPTACTTSAAAGSAVRSSGTRRSSFRGRELPRRSVPQRLDGLSDGGRARGRLLAPDQLPPGSPSPSTTR